MSVFFSLIALEDFSNFPANRTSADQSVYKIMKILNINMSIRPKQTKKLFGCPPLPAPNFEKMEKSFYCTKVYRA